MKQQTEKELRKLILRNNMNAGEIPRSRVFCMRMLFFPPLKASHHNTYLLQPEVTHLTQLNPNQ